MFTIRFTGLIASPFQLKMQALADYAECGWQRWPDQAPSVGAAWRNQLALLMAKRRGSVRRYPELHSLDEYPEVPYYQLDNGPYFYDSTALAHHLDALDCCGDQPLLPSEPALNFVARLVDEAFDEFGLYMVHHMRWAGSKRTTPMGELTVNELRKLLPRWLRKRMSEHAQRRQSRRCAYLFSVAPQNFDMGLAPAYTPPSLPGFPQTHSLLNSAWQSYLAAMESLLVQQPYLLGDRFTLADASAYGQLSMNLVDGDATEQLRQLAPRTYDWLCAVRDGKHRGSSGRLYLSDALKQLLQIIDQTFVPLMQQNAAAYAQAVAEGEHLFNEAAFNKRRALYNGELMDYPFRAVVKTFQVRVWRELIDSWQDLAASKRSDLRDYLPEATVQAFDQQTTEVTGVGEI